jgi:hypothetical protein
MGIGFLSACKNQLFLQEADAIAVGFAEFPLPRRGLIENDDAIKALRAIGEKRAAIFYYSPCVFLGCS